MEFLYKASTILGFLTALACFLAELWFWIIPYHISAAQLDCMLAVAALIMASFFLSWLLNAVSLISLYFIRSRGRNVDPDAESRGVDALVMAMLVTLLLFTVPVAGGIHSTNVIHDDGNFMLRNFVLFYILAINLVAFSLFAVDKYKARHNRWRIPESTLWFSALLGGGLGAFAAMRLFRHKTQHLAFVLGIPAMLLVNGIVFFWLYRQIS